MPPVGIRREEEMRAPVSAVVITEFIEEGALEAFPPGIDLLYDPALVDQRHRLLAALGGAEALIVRNRTRVDAELLEAGPQLKVVGRLGVGLDNIDLSACRQRGIAVYPAVGANSVSVAEYVIAAALLLLRGAFFMAPEVLAGAWPRQKARGLELAGRSLGLVGYGSIAQVVAQRARALGMSVLASDPYLPSDHPAWLAAERLSLRDLLARADVVSLHVPLQAETRGLIDAAAIASMKPGAILINTARGGVVDEAALVAALETGTLGGAALDVYEEEPLTAAAARRFRGVERLLLTPHVAGLTEESDRRVSRLTVENVIRGLGLLDG